jgi:hypothetical protein
MPSSHRAGKGSRPPFRLAPLPPRRPTVEPPKIPVPLWDGHEPLALEPIACQRAWQLRQWREPYRTKKLEELIGQLRAKWHAIEPDWALIESELRAKAAWPSPAAPPRGARKTKERKAAPLPVAQNPKQQAFLDWVAETFNGKLPADTTDQALATQFTKANRRPMSESTVRRALGRKK